MAQRQGQSSRKLAGEEASQQPCPLDHKKKYVQRKNISKKFFDQLFF